MNYRPQKIKKGVQNDAVAPMISIGKNNTVIYYKNNSLHQKKRNQIEPLLEQ
jgi:hypothetical protein